MNAPHRLPGVAPDELESFRINSHVELVTLLRSLVRARSRCSVQFGEGAQDFLVKGKFDGPALVRAMRHSLERKRILEALRENEQRYKLLIESTSDYNFGI